MKIFVSSTYIDLVPYRDVVQKAIRQLGADAIGMEDIGARDARPLDECLRLIQEQADVFVGFYAHRYGFIPPNSHVSITEAEYRMARSCKVPVLAYIIDDSYPWIPMYIDQEEDGRRLRAFKEELCTNHTVKRFGQPFQLSAFIAADLAHHNSRMGLSDARNVQDPVKHKTVTQATTRNLFPAKVTALSPPIAKEWNDKRFGVYGTNRNIFLHYDIEKSGVKGQKFDVAIYLVRKSSKKTGLKRDDLYDVDRAEFFFGPNWGDNLYIATNRNEKVGIVISAYGEFLAYCRVHFKAAPPVDLYQFIRFPEDD